MIIVVESGCDDQVGAFPQPIKGPICKLSPWIQSSKGLILHRLSVYQHNCTALSPTLCLTALSTVRVSGAGGAGILGMSVIAMQ